MAVTQVAVRVAMPTRLAIRRVGVRVLREWPVVQGLQAERADESGHEDDRQERGRPDDVRVARNDCHAGEPEQEASRHSSASICAFYTC